MYMGVLSACMFFCTMCVPGIQESIRKGYLSLRDWTYRQMLATKELLGNEPGPVEGQPSLVTVEPSLHSPPPMPVFFRVIMSHLDIRNVNDPQRNVKPCCDDDFTCQIQCLPSEGWLKTLPLGW